MSVEAIAIALHHSRAGGTAKLVLLGIANHDGDGGSWPAIRTLARYAHTTERSVQRSIERLVQLGEIDVARQAGGTPQMPDHVRPNRYTFTLRCPSDCDHSAMHRTPTQDPLDRVTPASPGDTSVTPPGDTSVTPRVTPVSPEPSLEPSLETDSALAVGETPGRASRPVDKYGRQPCLRCGKAVDHVRTDGIDEPSPHARPDGSRCIDVYQPPAALPVGGWRALVDREREAG